MRRQRVSFQDSTYEILLSGALGTVLCRNLRTESNIAARCAQFRVSRSTIMRWIRKYQHDERLSGLLRRPFAGRDGTVSSQR
jgi:transposase